MIEDTKATMLNYISSEAHVLLFKRKELTLTLKYLLCYIFLVFIVKYNLICFEPDILLIAFKSL